ncbi:MAG: glycoside hydrolase [Actinomycetota bacterium]|nr:glycoside hydrolase [Actinomycetota bacterium]
MRRLLLCLMLLALVPIAGAGAATSTEAKVSDQPYVRHDGGTDGTIATCNNESLTGTTPGGNRQQNEPTVAIDQKDSSFIAAGANDYCTVPATRDAWEGVYVSNDGGGTWIDSLLPGYPGDTSTEGKASPLYGVDTNSGDPIMDWDNSQNLFVGGIAFNRTVPVNENASALPSNGNMYVATYKRDASQPLGVDYLRTVIVGKGTPGAFPFAGRFNDKPSIKVDDWSTATGALSNSLYQGNVYVAWALFPGSGHNQILFSRSTNHGVSFSPPIKINKGTTDAQGADVVVASNGDVYVFWREFTLNNANQAEIVFAKSTNGGLTFGNPQRVWGPLQGYDRSDIYVTGGRARDCGSLIFLCVSHFTFHRTDTLPNGTADKYGGVYATWEQLDPALADNGDTYHPDGQSQVVVSKSTNGGGSWTAPTEADHQALGHQFWPNLEYDMSADRLVLTYYDSRFDPSPYSPYSPPGNEADKTSPCQDPVTGVATQPCNVLNTYIAVSPGGDGVAWSPTKVSTVGHQPNFEMFGNRRVPFQGDYIWVDADAGSIFGTWTDNRDVVPGNDPREADHDGFDVWQCRTQNPDGSFSSDNCPNAGGLNQNIYGAALTP